MKLIFLDFDGVLNSDHFLKKNAHKIKSAMGLSNIDPEGVRRLDAIVEGCPEAKIVISSSWRHHLDVWHLKNLLFRAGSKVASKRVIDRTPVGEGHRGTEIQDWLDLDPERAVVNPDHEPVTGFVILDDVDDMLPDQKSHFVHVNPKIGLTDQDVEKAIEILNTPMFGEQIYERE